MIFKIYYRNVFFINLFCIKFVVCVIKDIINEINLKKFKNCVLWGSWWYFNSFFIRINLIKIW